MEENSLIMKNFVLHMVNRYGLLLYTAFYLKDIDRLRYILGADLTLGALWNNLIESYRPLILAKMKSLFSARSTSLSTGSTNGSSIQDDVSKPKELVSQTPDGAPNGETDPAAAAAEGTGGATARRVKIQIDTQSSPPDTNASSSADPSTPMCRKKFRVKRPDPNSSAGTGSDGNANDPDRSARYLAMIHRELLLDRYHIHEDYLEMVLQFGYVSTLSVCFPITALLAYINNLYEGATDLKKLSECRRPPVYFRSTIGAWQTCLDILSFAGLLTNCYILAMTSTHFETIVPPGMADFLETETGRIIFMLLLCNFLIVVKVCMIFMIGEVPRHIQAKEALKHLQDKERAGNMRLQLHTLIKQQETLLLSQAVQAQPPSVPAQSTPTKKGKKPNDHIGTCVLQLYMCTA